MREFEVAGGIKVTRVKLGAVDKVQGSQRLKPDFRHAEEDFATVLFVRALGLRAGED